MENLIRRQSTLYGPKPVLYEGIPLMITNVGDENSVITLIPYGSFNARIYYKKDDDKFYKKWNYNAITLQPNSTLSLFGDSDVFSSSSSNYANFSIVGSSIKLSGRLASISHARGVKYSYYKLFQNCTSVVEVSSDFLEGVYISTTGYSGDSILSYLFSNTGITQVPEGFFDFRQPVNSIYVCLSVYAYMFKDCKSLVSVPQNIFAKETFICQKQYQGMFSGCSSLIQAPDIYATNAPWSACASMFSGCVSLENPPQIVYNGYSGQSVFESMFYGCTSLKQSPIMNDLIKDHSDASQHNTMFKDCSSLNHVEVSFTQWKVYNSSNNRLYSHTVEWLANVSPTGTFVCPKELAEATDGYYDEEGNFVAGVGRGVSTVPEGWTIDYPIIDARGGDANAMALMAVISQQTHADGTPWVKDSLVMMKSEAEAVTSISSVFNQIKQTYSFEAFQYFTLIKSIDNSCFGGSNSSYLTKLTLPYSVVSINQNAFSGCTRLNLVIPENSLLKTIGNQAFRMTDIKSLYIPKLVSSISNNAFVSTAIKSFEVSDENTIYRSENHCIIKDNIIVIGGLDFDATQSMNGTIDTIGVNAFNGRGLSKIIIPKGILTLQNSCYHSNTNAKSLYIPDTVISIAHDSFNLCCKLESIEVEAANQKYESINNTLIEKDSGTLIIGCKNSTIPSDVITLSDYCFYDCEGLETVNIPDSVTTIGIQAFDNISSLKKVTIGSGVSNIKDRAFIRTNNLGKIKINAIVPPTITSNSFTTNVIIYVPNDSVEAYKSAKIWSTMADRIKPLSEYTE